MGWWSIFKMTKSGTVQNWEGCVDWHTRVQVLKAIRTDR